MKPLKALLLVPVLLALCVGTAGAKSAPGPRAKLDPHFGRGGVAKTATALKETEVLMAVAPGGKTYVLQGLTVLAFDANGKPNREFGENGRVNLYGPAVESVKATAIAVGNGQIFVTGWIDRPNRVAWVISILPNGLLNRAFGVGGEVQTGFLIPPPIVAGIEQPSEARYEPTSIVIDGQGRPLIGGQAVTSAEPCAFGSAGHPVPFVARLTTGGLTDTSFAGRGYAILGERGYVSAMSPAPNGELATIDNQRLECEEHEAQYRSNTGRLTEAGIPSPSLDPARLTLNLLPLLAVDQDGRSLVIATDEVGNPPDTVIRLAPSGAVDTTFGHEGGTSLAGLLEYPSGLAVDAKGRPLVAAGRAGVELVRLRTDGKRDSSFGPKGVVRGGAAGNSDGRVGAIGLDQRGRIYVAGWVKSKSLKTGYGVQMTRFLPGS